MTSDQKGQETKRIINLTKWAASGDDRQLEKPEMERQKPPELPEEK
jgi:hypothetical protein